MTQRSIALVAGFGALLALTAVSACPADVNGEGEGEGAGGEGEGGAGEGEGEGEGTAGEGEGEGEGACAPTPVCTATPTATLTLNVNGVAPSVAVNGGAGLAVGGATRADVENALGGSGAEDGGALRVDYCDAGLQFQYVDADGTLDASSLNGAPTDVVARIATLPGVVFTPPAITADGNYVVGTGHVRFDSGKGVEVIEDGAGVLQSLILFKPQSGDHWGLDLVLSPGSQTFAGLDVGNATFSDYEAVLGNDFDADGVLTVTVGGFPVPIRVVIWASTGVRLAGACLGGCDDGTTVQTVSVSPPFLGVDGTGLGLGAAKADIDAAFGTGTPDTTGAVVYGNSNGSKLAVGYVQDANCTDRAAGFALGYTAQ